MRLAGRAFCAVYSCQQFFNLLRLRRAAFASSAASSAVRSSIRVSSVDRRFSPLGEVIFAQADGPALPRKAGKLPDRKTEADRGDDASVDRQRPARALFLLFRLCRLLSSGFLGLLLGRFWRFCSPHRGVDPALRLRRDRRARGGAAPGFRPHSAQNSSPSGTSFAALDTGRHIPSPFRFSVCLYNFYVRFSSLFR